MRINVHAIVVCCLLVGSADFLRPKEAEGSKLQSNPEQLPPSHVQSTKAEVERITFKLVRTSDGQSDDGTFWTMIDLAASDGHTVFKQTFPYSSVGRASKQFQLFLKAAVKTLRRTSETNEKGEVVGERVLALFPRTSTMGPHYTLFWTSGAQFSQITGEHLEDVLALENRLREKPLSEVLKQQN